MKERKDAQPISLATPLEIRPRVTLKNRLFKSAMSEQLGSLPGHLPTEGLATLYRRWARGGIGLCITGNVMIDRRALGEPRNVVLEEGVSLAPFEMWARAGTENGTHLWMQLNHPGKQIPRFLSRQPVAPSAVPLGHGLEKAFHPPRALDEEEIRDLIRRFGRSAALAREAGFTGVQIHGAHGYLVSQFLSPHHNRREDAWGGSEENRRRFVLEVYRGIRKALGPDFPVSIKLNSADFQKGGFTEEESMGVIQALAAEGIDMIEISGGNYERPAMTGALARKSTLEREAYFIEFSEKARGTGSVAIGLTGGFRSARGMTSALRDGATDLVGLARPLAVLPDLPDLLISDEGYRVDLVRPSTGLKVLDRLSMLDITWYEHQLARMAQGEQPKQDEGPWSTVLKTLWHTGLDTFRQRRA